MATKNHLAKLVSSKIPDLPPEDSSEVIDSVFDYLKAELCAGNRVEIRGFGSFSVRKRKFAGRNESYKTVYYRGSGNVIPM